MTITKIEWKRLIELEEKARNNFLYYVDLSISDMLDGKEKEEYNKLYDKFLLNEGVINHEI